MSSDDWGSWRAADDRSRTVGLEVSVDERLAWLESALEVAHAAGALPRPRDDWGQPLKGPRERP